MTSDEVTVVTVTYGDRWDVGLKHTVDSVMRDPRLVLIVVLNGSAPATRQPLDAVRAVAPHRIHLIDLESNRGSAPAFAAGLAAAYLRRTPVLLLDDDNPLPDGAIDRLTDLSRRLDETDHAPAALACYRAVNPVHAMLRDGARVASCFREVRPGAFGNTDVFRDSSSVRPDVRFTVARGDGVEHLVEIPNTMWGGLYLPLSIVELGVLPPTELVLYADDNAFSGLLRAAGCRILLCLDIEIVDTIDWRESADPPRRRIRIPRVLRTPRAQWWRVQYQSRNAAYLSVLQTAGSRRARLRLAVNATVRLGLLFVAAVVSGHLGVYARVCRATIDGMRGRLGPTYRLPAAADASATIARTDRAGQTRTTS